MTTAISLLSVAAGYAAALLIPTAWARLKAWLVVKLS